MDFVCAGTILTPRISPRDTSSAIVAHGMMLQPTPRLTSALVVGTASRIAVLVGMPIDTGPDECLSR